MGRHSSFPSARHPESESSPLGMVERVVPLGSNGSTCTFALVELTVHRVVCATILTQISDVPTYTPTLRVSPRPRERGRLFTAGQCGLGRGHGAGQCGVSHPRGR